MHTALSARTVDGEPPLFVGREHARGLLEGLVGGVHEVGSAAVIRSEAGMGKTALLQHIASRASVRALWVQGVESEAVLPFAAAADLLVPLRDFFDELPDVQRNALEISLALTTGTVMNPLAPCSAALGVLAAAAGKEPLLVLVDDFQWVDPPSQQLLLFIARRLEADRVVLLLAVRDGPGQPQTPIELPTIRLGGMSVAECGALIHQLGLEVSAQVLRDVVAQTGGNPLAIIETVRAARPEQLSSTNSGIDRAILGLSLEQTWSTVIVDLPEGTRTALLLLAASRSAHLADIGPPLAALGLSLDDLESAEQRGLVLVSGDGVQLLHPLLRSVILTRAPTATRLGVFRALAGATDGHLSAWYLAAATT